LPDCPAPNVNRLGTRDCGLGIACGPESLVTAPGKVSLHVRQDGLGVAGAEVFTSIGAALGAVAGKSGEVAIIVHKGTYRESLVVDRPVAITGTCTADVAIEGANAAAPVIDVRSGARGFTLTGVTLGGKGSAGLRLDGVEEFNLTNLVIDGLHGIDGPGVTVEDTAGPAAGTFAGRVIVDGALGVGIAGYGVNPLKLVDVVVVRTRPDASGRAVGIHVAPSATLSTERYQKLNAPVTLPVQSSVVTIDAARVDDAVGVGIWVEGVTATIDGAVVRGVTPDSLGQATGVLVEPRLQGLDPAELVLGHSVVSGVAGTGVRIEDAKALIEDGTITDLRIASAEAAAAPTGACGGNAIRARSRLPANLGPEGDEGVTIRRTVLDGARESAVHVEGV
jgi:hypothetical protein